MSLRRILTAGLITFAVLGVLSLDVAMDEAVGTFALVLLCTCLALGELLALMKRAGLRVHLRTGFFAGIGLILIRGALEVWGSGLLMERMSLVLVSALVLGGILALFGFGPTVLAVLWVAGSMMFVFDLRLLEHWAANSVVVSHVGSLVEIPYGLALIVVVGACVKGGDSAAYAVGRTIGRTPMAPRISPRKTWEGAVGGLVVGTACAPLLGALLGLTVCWGTLELLILGAATNVAGQLGDLAESWIKRKADAKDSGAYLGELGGALDILDAALAAAPVAYLIAYLLGAR